MDRTRQAVEMQLRAMGADSFELALFSRAPSTEVLVQRLHEGGAGTPLVNRQAERLARAIIQETAHRPLRGSALEEAARRIQQQSARMRLQVCTPAEILADVARLRHQNRQGLDIYIRAYGSIGLVLVDDLTAAALVRMKCEGAVPALVIETSPGNYQAWLGVSPVPIAQELATAVARDLADHYGGDRASAHYRHLGRVAGFTNQKPNRVIADGPHRGLQPFVLVREARGGVAPAGADLLARARERLAREPAVPALRESFMRALSLLGREHAPEDEGALAALYREQASRLVRMAPAGLVSGDPSRLDWAVVRDLRAAGHPPEIVAGALRAGSPHLEERKAGHVDDYVARTVSKVFSSPIEWNAVAERAPPQAERGTLGR